jgi:hypothetical protein
MKSGSKELPVSFFWNTFDNGFEKILVNINMDVIISKLNWVRLST